MNSTRLSSVKRRSGVVTMRNDLSDLPLFAPQVNPDEAPKQKRGKGKPVAEVTAPQSNEVTIEKVITYYRVNCTRDSHNTSGLSKAYEEAVEHLCLTYGNLITLEAIKTAILNNKQVGRPSMNFISAIAKSMYAEEEQGRVRRAAIERAAPEAEIFVPVEDAFAKLRREFMNA